MLNFKTKADLENISFVCDIITVIVGYIEIDRFKVNENECVFL